MGGVDRRPEAPGALGERPVDVQLIGEVRQDQALRARPGAVLARLLRREVAAGAFALGPRQCRLDQQQVGAGGEVAQLLVGRAVGGEGEPCAVGGELDGVGRDEVWDRLKAGLQPPSVIMSAGS